MPLKSETPKERFNSDKNRVEAHRFILSHAQFDASIDAAFAQMSHEMNRDIAPTPTEAAARAYALSGAQTFIRTFKNLTEVVEPPKRSAIPSLNQNA